MQISNKLLTSSPISVSDLSTVSHRTRQPSTVVLPTPWIVYRRPLLDARVRLFCFPHAGAGASLFRAWPKLLQPHEVELCAVQLPGRETRLNEQPHTDLERLLEQLVKVLQPFCDRPLALFGHSMGGLLAWAVAQRMQQMGAELAHVIISGATPPGSEQPQQPIHLLPEEEFLSEVMRFNGMPAEVLQNRELLELILPTLRADFALCVQAEATPATILNCPLSVYTGIQDQSVAIDEAVLWRQQTNGRFRVRKFLGDHFFLVQHEKEVVSALAWDLWTPSTL